MVLEGLASADRPGEHQQLVEEIFRHHTNIADVELELTRGGERLRSVTSPVAEVDQAFTGVAIRLSGLFTLMGQRELADKVRRSTRPNR